MRLRTFLCLFALSCLPVFADSFCNPTWTWTDFGINPLSVRRATLTPLRGPANGTGVTNLSKQPIVQLTDTNGSVTFTNVFCPYSYTLKIEGPSLNTTVTNYFQSGLTGSVSAYTNQGVWVGDIFAYFHQGGGGGSASFGGSPSTIVYADANSDLVSLNLGSGLSLDTGTETLSVTLSTTLQNIDANYTVDNTGNTTLPQSLTVTGAGSFGSISGSGTGITALSAGNLSSGTVPDARFSGTYTSALTLNNAANSFTGSFIGSFPNGVTNSTATASTMAAFDANKKLVSVANGPGVLTNNGSGTLSWVAVSGGGGVSSFDGVSITTNSAGALTATNTVATLTDAATIAIDASGATNEFVVTLGGNRTLAIPTGGWDGETRLLELGQDATGNRTITLASPSGGLGWDVPITIDPTGANALTLSTNANVSDRCVIVRRGTNWSFDSFKRGYRKRS